MHFFRRVGGKGVAYDWSHTAKVECQILLFSCVGELDEISVSYTKGIRKRNVIWTTAVPGLTLLGNPPASTGPWI